MLVYVRKRHQFFMVFKFFFIWRIDILFHSEFLTKESEQDTKYTIKANKSLGS